MIISMNITSENMVWYDLRSNFNVYIYTYNYLLWYDLIKYDIKYHIDAQYTYTLHIRTLHHIQAYYNRIHDLWYMIYDICYIYICIYICIYTYIVYDI